MYDTQGHAAQIATPEGSINYEYDAVTGRKTATWTNDSRTEYAYDALGRLDIVKQTERNNTTLVTPEVTAYAYNDTGSRASITYGGEKVSGTLNDENSGE